MTNTRSVICFVTLFTLILTICNATFCSNLTSIDDKTTPCFLEQSTESLVVLRTSGNTLVLPCHVARSKRAIVEWWYTDPQKAINIKIYPIFPAIRPTVLRFMTSLPLALKKLNETDILDASVLLRHANVDDSGTYRCIIRPWSTDPLANLQEILFNDDSSISSLNYQVEITAPRLCQMTLGPLPCFSAMRTSSPTIIDAYHSAFLQCVVNNFNRPVNVFWVVGNLTTNNVLITEYLATNQYGGDRLRRISLLSPYDFSLELVVNRTKSERTYSCVIDGATDIETTIFTYIIRTLNPEEPEKHLTETIHIDEEKKIVPHDSLKSEQINSLHEQQKIKIEEEKNDIDEVTSSTLMKHIEATETSTTI